MHIGIVSYRLAGYDGVTLIMKRWREILKRHGHKITFVAGELDENGIIIPGLNFATPEAEVLQKKLTDFKTPFSDIEEEIVSRAARIESALNGELPGKFDCLIFGNMFSLPVNPPATVALSNYLSKNILPNVNFDSDFWWERDRYIHAGKESFFKKYYPGELPLAQHVVINKLAQRAVKERLGIDTEIIGDCFDFESGVNRVNNLNGQFRKDFNLTDTDIIFLQATRIIPRKNIELAIELVKKMDDPRIILLLAGSSGDEGQEYLEKLQVMIKELGIRARFIEEDMRRFGYCLWDCFANADLSTFPSAWEGFGNQFIEAIYFKKPIFVNRYPVFISDIEPLGFQTVAVDWAVTEDAVSRIRYLLDHPDEIQKMTEINFEIGKNNFSFEATSKKLEKLGL